MIQITKFMKHMIMADSKRMSTFATSKGNLFFSEFNRFVLVVISLVVCFVTSEAAGKRSSGPDGFYTPNPMLWADVPDPDVIRVGDTYYMAGCAHHALA